MDVQVDENGRYTITGQLDMARTEPNDRRTSIPRDYAQIKKMVKGKNVTFQLNAYEKI